MGQGLVDVTPGQVLGLPAVLQSCAMRHGTDAAALCAARSASMQSQRSLAKCMQTTTTRFSRIVHHVKNGRDRRLYAGTGAAS